MRFFIVDDDEAVRSMLAQIIEDQDLGEVAGEAADGSHVDTQLLRMKKVDILLIDLMMPVRDGIETIRQLNDFAGKIIMISQIESKEMIGEAYSLGVEYYITKPINRLEVCGVIQKVRERMRLERSIRDIRKSLNALLTDPPKEENPYTENSILTSAKYLLSELGIISESGSKDLLEIVQFLFHYEKEKPVEHEFPPLKEIYMNLAMKKLGKSADPAELNKEVKASEQRVRRAIFQSLSHIASIGLTDYSNPTFENASKFFDFREIRKRMLELENETKSVQSGIRLNPKKFIQVLYLEAKHLM
ncbi:DNA-binding domain-containing protein [Lihuaxuella thermophila]|uniref:Two-component system, response regulator YcbB n=1 Tax=Lihuaxuella thermophila TaxID=1173111 RepID=A0A1H8BS01_9BACL|nr:DNA-binding domain-containing protein [Lihuaxuella thermophila]SEM84914.1 two-component system, response regulator YcbB [Lihuaxuella thermophila]